MLPILRQQTPSMGLDSKLTWPRDTKTEQLVNAVNLKLVKSI
jgi:hypothetical protein